jgi:GT2 family glycosyltransferase
MNSLDLSIIIVSWKVKDLLKNCLTSIFKETAKIKFEVIVIDNGSVDETVEMVAGDFPQVKIISNLRNRGFAKANNQGIKQAQGRYILLLNPDTIIINQALDKIVEFMDKHQQAGIIGCKLLNPDYSTQPSVRKFPVFVDHLIMMFKLHHLFTLKRYLITDFDYNKESEVEQVMGAFFLINKEVIKKIGLLDEGYYIWFEEVDYCFRAKQAGFSVIYTPMSQIIHLGGQSFLKALKIKNQWNFCISRLRYIYKNQNLLMFFVILLLTPFSLLLSLLFSLIAKK